MPRKRVREFVYATRNDGDAVDNDDGGNGMDDF